MLDINKIRNNPDDIKKALLKKIDYVDFTELLAWDKVRREKIGITEEFKAKKNKVSSMIPVMKKNGEDIKDLLSEMKQIGESIKNNDIQIKELEENIKEYLSSLPNPPDEDVVSGGKENNEIISVFGDKPKFNFEPKDHIGLAESLKLIDYKRGAKIAGNGYWIYTNLGARLEWALLNYFIEEHIKDGYEFMLPPHILTYESGYAAGQFPKFIEDVYEIEKAEEKEKMHFLLPTAETALINIHRDEILTEEEVPRKYFSYTPCYRKEAGSYRSEERGMIRGHQFNKIEMFQFTKPEDSDDAFEELVAKAERLLQGLGLHYRLSKLAAKDCSAAMARTYDPEIWIPSMNIYKEASSVSNSRDYQARRGNMRFRRKGEKRTEFLHTLNGSGLATSRLFPAILEQHQQGDGSIKVPEPLVKWMGMKYINI